MQLRAVFSKEVSFSLWQTGVVRHLKGLSWWLSGKESACNAGDTGDEGSIPGLERSPGGGPGKPLQCSCLENPMDRGAWWATVHGVTESDTTEQMSTPCANIWNLRSTTGNVERIVNAESSGLRLSTDHREEVSAGGPKFCVSKIIYLGPLP